MRLVALVPLWRREAVAELVLQRLRKQRIQVVCVGSEGAKSRRIAEANGCRYIEAPNSPLGVKFNIGLRHCKSAYPDAVMVLGSDNMVTDGYLDEVRARLENGADYVGLRGGLVYEHEMDRLTLWPGYTGLRKGEPLGSGRCFTAALLDKLDWTLWDDEAERSLDATATARLNSVTSPVVIETRMPGDYNHEPPIAHLGIRTFENLSTNITGTDLAPQLVDELFGHRVRQLPRVPRALRSDRVTVIVPVLDEDWEDVARTTTSAFSAGASQVVVVDDGSRPPLRPIKHANNLRHHRNRGISAALNTGLARATGDWVCWLSVGDTMHKHKLRKQLHYTHGLASFHDYTRESTGEVIRPIEDWAGRIYSDNQFSGSTIMVARSVLEAIGGFDESLRWCQDWDMAVRIQATVGWEHVPHVLGTGSGVARHSAVHGDEAKLRWKDRARVAERARKLQRMTEPERAAYACLERQ